MRPLTNRASSAASASASTTEITVVATAKIVVFMNASRKFSSDSRLT